MFANRVACSESLAYKARSVSLGPDRLRTLDRAYLQSPIPAMHDTHFANTQAFPPMSASSSLLTQERLFGNNRVGWHWPCPTPNKNTQDERTTATVNILVPGLPLLFPSSFWYTMLEFLGLLGMLTISIRPAHNPRARTHPI